MYLASNIWQFLPGSVLGHDGSVSKVPHPTLTKVCATSFRISGNRRRQALLQEDGVELSLRRVRKPPVEALAGGVRS